MSEKVFVSEDNTAVITCPSCKRIRKVDLSGNKKLTRAYTIKCRCQCGHVYTVILEKRQHYRKDVLLHGKVYKKVRLPGSFTKAGSNKETEREERIEKGVMLVKNLSRTGLEMEVNDMRNIEKDDLLLLEFNLDDANRSLIKKRGIVRWVNLPNVGVMFDPGESFNPSDQAIAFYLLP